jgi:hypothetical protein
VEYLGYDINGHMLYTERQDKKSMFRILVYVLMRARSKLIKSADVSLYNQSTSEVAQRTLMESSQDSNEGDRENDTLTNALGTKE